MKMTWWYESDMSPVHKCVAFPSVKQKTPLYFLGSVCTGFPLPLCAGWGIDRSDTPAQFFCFCLRWWGVYNYTFHKLNKTNCINYIRFSATIVLCSDRKTVLFPTNTPVWSVPIWPIPYPTNTLENQIPPPHLVRKIWTATKMKIENEIWLQLFLNKRFKRRHIVYNSGKNPTYFLTNAFWECF